MSSVNTSENGNDVTLSIEGEFTFNIHTAFRNAYKTFDSSRHFIIDLSNTSYMDSSGLGMIIQLRDFAGGDSAQVNITGANEIVSQVLKVAKFDQLFTLN